jgi:hypothetical protein
MRTLQSESATAEARYVMCSVFTSSRIWRAVRSSLGRSQSLARWRINQTRHPDAVLVALGAGFARGVTRVIAGSLDMCRMCFWFRRGKSRLVSEVIKMSVPLKATSYHTTERLLELALTMLENARREQNTDQLPANNWLTDNFTLEIIRAKVAANKANAILKV